MRYYRSFCPVVMRVSQIRIWRIGMKIKAKGAVTLIGSNMPEVKVCDIVNGKPKVKRIEKENYMEFHLCYSLFRKEIKRYDKNTFKELK